LLSKFILWSLVRLIAFQISSSWGFKQVII
jgi:hypothetical protein